MEEIKTLPQKSHRNYGIDLLRIVSMLMIVFHHCFVHGNFLENMPSSLESNIILFVERICYVAVNLYALISGYVLINNKFTYLKLVNLWLQVFFYSAIIGIIFFAFSDIGLGQLLFTFMPFISFQYWYFSAYVCLFLLVPFINKMLLSLNKRQHFILIVTLFLFFSVIPLCSFIFYSDFFNIENGYNPMLLIYLYIIGAYINRHDNSKNKKLNINIINLIVFLFVYILFFLFKTHAK